jgi:hypothetical protein
MLKNMNCFESCMKRAGVSIQRTNERRHFIVQAPPNPLSCVRSYFQGLTTGPCAVRLHQRLVKEEKQEPSAVPESVQSASPLKPSSAIAAIASSPDLTLPSVLTQQKQIREQQLKWNDNKRKLHTKFLQCFQMLRTLYCSFDAIECATFPKVFLCPCRSGDTWSKECLQHDSCSRQLLTTVFATIVVKEKQKVGVLTCSIGNLSQRVLMVKERQLTVPAVSGIYCQARKTLAWQVWQKTNERIYDPLNG